MTMKQAALSWCVLLAGVTVLWAEPEPRSEPLAWPPVTKECRPWCYWWWMGSAVDPANLTKELQRYQQASLGGVHIIPIYGAKGWEDKDIDFLSPKWMDMLKYTIREAQRLGLGVDMTTGTGWCFGGPQVPEEEAGMKVRSKLYDVPVGGKLQIKL